MIGYDGKPVKFGKGDRPRKYDTKKYADNYEKIFGSKKPKKKKAGQ